MKPIKLVISGWGPYKEKEEVDFQAVSERGIFLITGPTGAGKTTIFDAITYALYGDLSGSLRQKTTVRSDFADVQTPTYVEFTMEHDRQIYRIRRNPEYLRPRRKKGAAVSLAAEKENAVLYFADGSVLEGNREVNEKVRSILRLDLRQFRQISMIAQGEFAQLLHAGGEEKMRIFREIFDTSVYDLFLKKLKERAAGQEKQATEYLHRMEEDVRLFSSEDERFTALCEKEPYPYREIADLLLTMQKEAADAASLLEKEQKILEHALQENTAQLARAEQINESFAKLEKQKARQKELAAKQGAMEQEEIACRQAQAAADVYEVYCNLTQTDIEYKRQKLLLEEQERQIQALDSQQMLLRPAAECEDRLELLFKQQEVFRQKAKEADSAIFQAKKSRLLLEIKREKFVRAERKSRAKAKELDDLQRARQYSLIGLAAQLLREGEPCPVCGSVEHPRVASVQDGPDEEQIKLAQEAAEEAREEELRLHGEALAMQKQFEKQWEEAEIIWKESKREQAETVRLEQDLEEIRKLIETDEDEKADDVLAAQPGVFWPAPEQFRSLIRRFHETETAITEKTAGCRMLRENLTVLERRLSELGSALEEQKRRQGFDSDEAWKAALLDEDKIENKQQMLTAYKKECSVCAELLAHLQEEVKDCQPMDTDTLKEILAAQQEQSRQLFNQLQKQRLLKLTAGNTGRSLSQNQKKAQEALAAYGVVRDLENMASGNNPRRLVFEQYVLAGYFEDILMAANIRLKRMSDGRYELFRAEKISDGRKKDSLEIEVMDYYTGKRRSVRTLSGGETFKASLALALGLSDAVCAASGGVKVDTLFIDEGFGALDAQSLDQACTTLTGLAGEQRLIGIISHVSELKERITSQILVEKETVGSRIRVKI